MHYLIAIDSFKGCLSSVQAAEAIKKGLLEKDPESIVRICPMADGGEGTLFALTEEYERFSILTKASNGKRKYGLIGIRGDNAIIEMAQSVGLDSVEPDERNPELSTTFGVGMMIDSGLKKGIKHIYLCVGGSGTNDAGAGMLSELGAIFYDKKGNEIHDIRAKDLTLIEKADLSRVKETLADTQITIITDVRNELLGEQGASKVFAKQKGADDDMILRLEKSLGHYADVLEKETKRINRHIPGTGAGGGIVYSLTFFDNVNIVSGARAVIEYQGIEQLLDETNVLITGEGSVDIQSTYGKTIDVLCELAQKKNKPVIVFSGRCENPDEIYIKYPSIKKIYSTMDIAKDKTDSKNNASLYLQQLAKSI